MSPRNRLPLLALAAVTVSAGMRAGTAIAASPPYIQLVPTPVIAGTCTAQGPTPAIEVNVDLDGALYRYSPAYVIPNFFDDEGEFNLVWNQDATLIVSGYAQLDGPRLRAPLPVAPLSAWYVGFGRLPEHTELAMRVAAYDGAGRAVATSRMTWDCTTGAILRVEHRGNAAGAIPARLVEFHHAGLDHYFVTADATETAALDGGHVQGWQRTGPTIGVAAAPYDAAGAVCRFYMPPSAGDSHFYSASAQECADVAAKFPSFVLESNAVFAAALPDRATGACATGTLPVYRLWNARADSNHRYTTDPAIRASMLARGYVAEGYGAEGVAFCALP